MTKLQKAAAEYWIESSKRDFEVSRELVDTKNYNYALFFLHLSLEKLLKGIFVAKKSLVAPPIHDLEKITEKIGLSITLSEEKNLAEISSFNIKARYDDYKLKFYKKANKEYASKWFKIGQQLYKKFVKNL